MGWVWMHIEKPEPIFWMCCSHTILPEASMDMWMLSFPENSLVYTQKNTINISLFLPNVLDASERASCKHEKGRGFFQSL